MRNPRVFICLLVCLQCFGQSGTKSQNLRDPKAVAIAMASLRDMGAISEISTATRSVGAITFSDGTDGTITIESHGKNLRQEIVVSGEASTSISADGVGSSLVKGKKRALSAAIAKQLSPDHIPAISRLNLTRDSQTALAYIGQEEVNGRPVEHIQIWDSSAGNTDDTKRVSQFDVYVDVETHLVLKTDSYLFPPTNTSNRLLVETYYTDYRLVAGVLVPFHLTRLLSGNKQSEVQWQEISLDSDIPDSDFKGAGK